MTHKRDESWETAAILSFHSLMERELTKHCCMSIKSAGTIVESFAPKSILRKALSNPHWPLASESEHSVRFPPTASIVTAVHNRPRTHILDKQTLYYSDREIKDFKREFKRKMKKNGKKFSGDDSEDETEDETIPSESSTPPSHITDAVSIPRVVSSPSVAAQEAFCRLKPPLWTQCDGESKEAAEAPSHWIHCPSISV